jgi:hypothetical protein
VKPKLLYKVLNTDGAVSDWIELEYSLSENENEWHNTGNLVIDDLGDAIYFAFQAEFTANEGIYFLLDNFEVKGTITGSEIKKIAANNFKVYPNPITNQSVISFQTKSTGNVNLSVFDLQGRKICTLLDEKMNAGTHTIQLGNQLKINGVYLCKLATLEGVSTLKLIVNSNN